jgi:hypothetical protein
MIEEKTTLVPGSEPLNPQSGPPDAAPIARELESPSARKHPNLSSLQSRLRKIYRIWASLLDLFAGNKTVARTSLGAANKGLDRRAPIMAEQCPLLPMSGMPATYHVPNSRWKWIATDTRESYLKHGGHPLYGELCIDYDFNSFGYRSPEFNVTSDIRIIAIGCSHVMGVGLPREALFHELFAERLRSTLSREVVLWNLGLPGAANDYIARTLHLAIPYLDPHVVLVNFTHANRREYLSTSRTWMPYCPGHAPRDLVAREIKRHFEALSSPFDDDLNLFRNYKAIESLLSSRMWLYSTTSHPDADADPFHMNFARLRHHVDLERYVGPLRRIDLARDWSHFGPVSHETLAGSYWSRFCALDGLRFMGG